MLSVHGSAWLSELGREATWPGSLTCQQSPGKGVTFEPLFFLLIDQSFFQIEQEKKAPLMPNQCSTYLEHGTFYAPPVRLHSATLAT